MHIVEDDLTRPAVIQLLHEHLASMAEHSPPQSIHALGLMELREPGITFWTAWEESELLGCGALSELEERHGEIKSMRTSRDHLGRGVGSALLLHIMQAAMDRSYRRLSLETGSGPAFAPAHRLYEKHGFEYCGPFGKYGNDPFSRFMTLELPHRNSPQSDT